MFLLKNIILFSIFLLLRGILDIQSIQNLAIASEKNKQIKTTRSIDLNISQLKEKNLLLKIESSLKKYKNINLVKKQQFPKNKSVKSGKKIPGQLNVTIVIDAFRAFTTASYVLEGNPTVYMITTKSTVVSRLASDLQSPLLIGKSERGAALPYDIPNSPTRVKELTVTGRPVLHRTEAGARGILLAKEADIVLAAGFVNAKATAKYIRTLVNPKIHLAPMGHEGMTPSLEDHVCAMYIAALINNEKVNLEKFTQTILNGPGKYFFSKDQWQYPHEDFKRCLETERHDFAIRAIIKDDYAILTRCE